MGNLVGAPITEKGTHTGITKDCLDYGVSSMQGWHIYMEDIPIFQPFLYAKEKIVPKENADGGVTNTKEHVHANPFSSKSKYKKINLPDHLLYAIFDGHGRTFAHIKEQAKLKKTSTVPNDPAILAASNRKGMELLKAVLWNALIDVEKEILRE
eukprot:11867293-Ditylum_brightwellii.AAC.1